MGSDTAGRIGGYVLTTKGLSALWLEAGHMIDPAKDSYSSRVGLIDVLEYQCLPLPNEFLGCTHSEQRR
jgi:choline dehydrogenase-like flavoprotein